MADREEQVEDLRRGLAERDQRISAAEAELISLKGSRLFRLRTTLAQPWSLAKVKQLGYLVASLLAPKPIKRGVRSVARTWPNVGLTATPAGRAEQFDPVMYRQMYPDIDASGSDPYEHYAAYGRREGRVGWLDMTHDLSGLDRSRPTALVVFHEGSRTGAPILGYNLVRRLLEYGNAVALFYRAGPMMAACQEAGAVVVGPELWRGAPFPPGPILFRRMMEQISPQFAIVNSVESRHVAQTLAELYVPTISLIHEFSAYIRPRGALTETAFWSGETIFSAEIVRDSAWASELDLVGIDFPVIQQGRCDLPEEGAPHEGGRLDEATLIRRTLRPAGFPSDGIVVLGLGSVIPRKGVDLFVECAARVCELAPDLPVRFVWIGKVDPDADGGYSVVLADQIRRADLDAKVVILDEVTNLELAYQSADVLLVSSRLDPLPNVAIDALAEGLPLVCFARATGIADILTQNGLAGPCVASYLSPESMAHKLIELAGSSELRKQTGADSARVAAATFDMDRYVSRLRELVERQTPRAEQEHRDVETLAGSGLIRFDFLRSPQHHDEADADTVRRYVRAWSSGIRRRKPFPGFHPGIYLEQHGVPNEGVDPLADYIRAGRPRGPWDFDLVTPCASPSAVPDGARIALHVHVHYPDLLVAILERLAQNQTRIDLLVSVTSDQTRREVIPQLESYGGGSVDVRLVPNRGRDIAPLLTEFAGAIADRYDIIGHVHTKKTADLRDSAIGREWYWFLLEHLLGGEARMADETLARMEAEPSVGMVFPDDPYVVGWTQNRAGSEALSSRLQLGPLPANPVFPVGSMFWARVPVLRPLFGLSLTWEDYPEEPVPYDGTILHAIERVLPMLATASGATILLSNVPGMTR